MAAAVDLYLGPDPRWVLQAVKPRHIRRVITPGGIVANDAKSLGIEVLVGDANKLSFDSAPIGISVHYPLLLKQPLLDRYQAVYNLHPGYLPWCRGLGSVSWAMWEKSPAGATLHQMTAAFDAGPIVDRIRVKYELNELMGEVHQRVGKAEQELFKNYWKRLAKGETLPTEPQQEPGSGHTRLELVRFLRQLRREPEWSAMKAEELIRLVQCFGNIEIEKGDRRFRVVLSDTGATPNPDKNES